MELPISATSVVILAIMSPLCSSEKKLSGRLSTLSNSDFLKSRRTPYCIGVRKYPARNAVPVFRNVITTRNSPR